MRNWRMLAVAASLLGGCVIYEEDLDGKGGPGRDGDDGTDGIDGDDGDDGTDTTDDPGDLADGLSLEPATAAQGSTTLVSLVSDGTVDLTGVQSVEFYGEGDVNVLTADSRGADEFLMTLQVPADGSVGSADLLVVLANGDAVMVDAAFSVTAATTHGGDDTGAGCD